MALFSDSSHLTESTTKMTMLHSLALQGTQKIHVRIFTKLANQHMRSLPLNCPLDSFSFDQVNIVRLKVFDAGRVGNADGVSRKIEPRLDHIASRSTDLRSD